MIGSCDDSSPVRRDAALVLLGFAVALRRSELVAFDALTGSSAITSHL